ncbi:hypothetical protein [Streptomyces broussonetiae]|uniref:hypothetical protein n=1 Tax=Streptomyces broussonetiae TaxID=2686304 RepID=UPI0035DA46BD
MPFGRNLARGMPYRHDSLKNLVDEAAARASVSEVVGDRVRAGEPQFTVSASRDRDDFSDDLANRER